jgi:F0F1-type ATP synthase assembly protein I
MPAARCRRLREKIHEAKVDFGLGVLRIPACSQASSTNKRYADLPSPYRAVGKMNVSMPSDQPDPKELGFYFALAQVGLEMVAPVGAGAILDHYLRWGPWATAGGAVLGLVGGLAHLVAILNKHDRSSSEAERGKHR